MPQELLDLIARLAELTDDELAELDTQLRELFDATNGEPRTAESVALMGEIAAAIETVSTESTARTEAAEELERQAAEIAARVQGEPEEPETPEKPAEPETPEEPAEETDTPAEPETPAEQPQAVAASNRPTGRAPLSAVARRQPATTRPRDEGNAGAWRIKAAGDVRGYSAGSPIRDMNALYSALADKVNDTRGTEGRYTVASIDFAAAFATGQRLDNAASGDTNIQVVRRALDATRAKGLTAAVCAPPQPRYEQWRVATDEQPIRDALAGFRADRGAITFTPPPGLPPASRVGEWTRAMDADAGAADKACFEADCLPAEAVEVRGLYVCETFSNMGSIAYPEFVAANTQNTFATYARVAENARLTAIDGHARTRNVTYNSGADSLGAVREVMYQLGLHAARMRKEQRAPRGTVLDVIVDETLRDLFRADVLRQMATASSGADDPFSIADERMNRWFANLGLRPIWHMDGLADEVFAAQADGATVGFPATVRFRMFFPGTWLELEQGRIDTGVYRDSALNARNRYQMFREEFWQLAYVGVDAGTTSVTVTACASGASAGTIAPACP